MIRALDFFLKKEEGKGTALVSFLSLLKSRRRFLVISTHPESSP